MKVARSACAALAAAFLLLSSTASAARLKENPGGRSFLSGYFECRGESTEKDKGCCEARARHEMALAVEAQDPKRAAGLNESAIVACPSFAPAYFALARLSLDLDGEGERLFSKLKGLLARAPKSPELLKLKARLDGWGRGL